MWVYAYPAVDLPVTAAERFRALFVHRQRWTRDDLEPYCQAR